MAPRSLPPLIISYGESPTLPYGTPPADIAGNNFEDKVADALPEGFIPTTAHPFAVIRNGDGHSVIREGNNCVYIDTGMQTLDQDGWFEESPLGYDADAEELSNESNLNDNYDD